MQLFYSTAANSLQNILHLVLKQAVIPILILSLMLNQAWADSSKHAAIRDVVSDLNDQNGIAVTIYNRNLALVKDVRQVRLEAGFAQLALRDVSAQMQAETALLRSLSHPDSLTVYEQNFDFDLLTPEKLLEKYVGKEVTIIKTNPSNGIETSEKATILSANNGVVMKYADRIETGINGRIVYHDVPNNLRDRPTLSTQLKNTTKAEQTVELSYLTAGLNWKADYVAELNATEDAIDLSGWVTLNNTSGTSFHNAKLQLVAGDVNRVQPEMIRQAKGLRVEAMAMADSAPMAEESLLEYHLYSLDRTTHILDNQTKQVALLSANQIPVKKTLVFKGQDHYYQYQTGNLGEKIKASILVEFENKSANHLGMPLPKGILRAYKKDSQGNAQFVGEDQIDHTSKNENVKLKLGEAFDVTANKMQTEFKVHSNANKNKNVFESAYKIVLHNAKNTKVTVLVQEPIPADWKILDESHPSEKTNSQLATWKIDIPAEGSTTLHYRTLVKY